MSDVADFFGDLSGTAKAANMAAQDDDPDEAARAVELSDSSGVPASAIYGDVDGFEKQHKAALGSAIINNNHFISDYLGSHPMAPRLSHDDLGALDTATDSITRVSGVASNASQNALRYLTFGFNDPEKNVPGFVEGFGREPIGSWMGDYPRQHPIAAAGWMALTGVPEIGLRGVSGVIHGLADEMRQHIEKVGTAVGLNGELLSRDIAAMFESEAMGLTGRHAMPTPEMQAVARGAVHVAEPYLRNGEMPPVGVHPLIDSMYKADAEANATALDKAVTDSAATATRERSPEFFSRFADGPAGEAKIRVDANAVARLYGDRPPEADDGLLGWVPDLSERLDATAGSGGYIDVPLRDWLAHIDPDVHKELRDDILVGDHGFTVNEAQAVPDWKAPEAVPEGEEQPAPVDHTGTVDTPTQVVRGAAGLEPMLAVGDRKLSLLRKPDNPNAPVGFAKADEYHLLDQNGNKVGWLDVIPSVDGKKLLVDNVGGFESKGYNPNSFGPALVRSLLRQLKEKYPDIEQIGGFRISGAREKANATGAAIVKLEEGNPQALMDFHQFLKDNWEHVTDDGQVEALFHTEDKGLAANSPLGQMVLQTLKRLVPKANSDVAHAVLMDHDPVWGAYIPQFKQIIVSLESNHPLGTAAHEAIHALRDMRLFTQDEWRTLEAASYEHNWEKKYDVASRWGDLPRSASIEESIAEAYRDWRNGKAMPPEVHTVFEKIKAFFVDLLKRVADHLGLRADNWDDIFHRVESGEVGSRDSFEQSGGITDETSDPKFMTDKIEQMRNAANENVADADTDQFSRKGFKKYRDKSVELSKNADALMSTVEGILSKARSEGRQLSETERFKSQKLLDEWNVLVGNKPKAQRPEAEGERETLYHGTSKDKGFKKLRDSRNGTWFTTDPAEASQYSVENDSMGYEYDSSTRGYKPKNTAARVIPMNHQFENTLDLKELPDKLKYAENYKKAQSEYFDEVRKQGYDSVRLPSKDGHSVVVSLDNSKLRPKYSEGGRGALFQRPEVEGPPPINIKAPFTEGKAIGIRQDIYKRYMKLIEQRHAEDLRADFAAAHDDERRRQTKEWKENAQAVRESVASELEDRPNILVDRLMSERGGELKLDPMSVREDLRESLPKEYFRRTNSVSADDLAGHFGYPSGDALVEHLAEVAQERKASGLTHAEFTKKLVDDEVQRRMESQYGWLEKNVLEDATERALSHNQIDILHEETLALAEHAGAQLPLERSAIDRELTKSFMATPTGSIKSSLWVKAAGKAGREAEEALLKDDPAEAFKAKQRQYNAVVQGKLALAYEKAAKALDKTAKRMGKLEPARGKPTPVESEYLNHIQDQLRRVGYTTRRSLENIRENIGRQNDKTVQQFVESKLAESGGYRDIPLAEFLWDPGFNTPLAKLTASQFYDFKNMIDGLVREGRDEQSIIREGERFDKDQIIGQMRNQLRTFDKQEIEHGDEAGVVKQYIANTTGIETLMNRWDRNDPRGIFKKFVSFPLAAAANAARRLEREMSGVYRELPDAGDLKKLYASPLDPAVWRYSNFTRENLLGLIQNAGNKSNWEVTARGWGADPQELHDWLVRNSTPEDWQRAQQLGKTVFADLIKRADAQYEHRYGSTIDKIPLTPFELEFPPGPDGQPRTVKLDGWYHPLTPDPTWKGKSRAKGSVYEDADFNHVATSNGYVRSRTGATYPVDLSFSKIPQLIKQQIHDISFRDAVLETQKVFRDPQFLNDVTEYYGKEYGDMLLPYLKNVANQQGIPSKAYATASKWSEYLRQNTIGTYIGFNPYTVMKHAPTAAFMSMADVGPARMLWAYKNLWLDQAPGGKTWWNFALEHSEELQSRERNWQDTFGATQNDIYGKSSAREKILQWGSWPVAMSDKLSAVPLWVARFDKSISEGSSFGEARDLADYSVRTQHGSTAITNQPLLVQGGGPLHGWLTSVYGFFGTVMQRRIELAHQLNDMYKLGKEGEIAKAGAAMPTTFKNIMVYVVLPTAIEEYVTGLSTEDRQGYGTHMTKAAVRGLSSSFLYLRDLAYGITTSHDASIGLLSSPVNDTMKSVRDVMKGRAAINRQHAGKTVQDFITTFGEASGMAPKEFANIARFGIDYANREAHPKAVSDWLRGLTRGTEKKREEK